jgi:hypothetical protein
MRAAVILHERLGTWSRQLRPRLSELSVRWFETRSSADLEGILEGLASPVVLIDLAKQPIQGLEALDLVRMRTPGARSLVLDPEANADTRILASELGATHVCPGFAPPPIVADMISRWIAIARRETESAGWSRTIFPETAADPWGWLNDYMSEPASRTEAPTASPRWPRLILER